MNSPNIINNPLGRYKKDFRIGSGTFGDVYHVTSLQSCREYVMKVVPLSDVSEEIARKTLQEAEVLARCKHFNIIRYKECFVVDNPRKMCLVMEYADGGDLDERIKQNSILKKFFPETTILNWFIQIVFAVQYLHENGILHRDLKARNIFLTYKNFIKVGDFGIARFLRNSKDLASTAIGTPFYLSPEICMRKPYNHKSDIWAIGCILYELCALRHPFQSEEFADLIVKILSQHYAPLDKSFTQVIHDLVSVLLRKDPEKRPTAGDILLISPLRALIQSYIKKHEKHLSSVVDNSNDGNINTPSPKERSRDRYQSPSSKIVQTKNSVADKTPKESTTHMTQKESTTRMTQKESATHMIQQELTTRMTNFSFSKLQKMRKSYQPSPKYETVRADGSPSSPRLGELRRSNTPDKSKKSKNGRDGFDDSPEFGKTFTLHSPK